MTLVLLDMVAVIIAALLPGPNRFGMPWRLLGAPPSPSATPSLLNPQMASREAFRTDLEVAANLGFVRAFRGVVLVVAAELPQACYAPVGDVETVLEGGGVFGVLGVAAAGDDTGVSRSARMRRRPHWIVGEHAIQRERVLPKDGQGPICIIANADEAQRIIKLTSPARVAVRCPQRCGMPILLNSEWGELAYSNE